MKSHTYAFVKERSHTEKMISHTQAFDKRNLSSKERGCLKTKVPETRNGKGKNRNTVKPRLTAASVIRSPRYYSYFFFPQESNANKFSLVSESRFQSNSDASMSSWWLQFSLPKASRISRLRMAWIYISYQIWKEFTRGKHTLNSTLKAVAKPTGSETCKSSN